MPRTLTLIGTGPGDPENLTLKAVRTIREAACVFAPVNRGKHRSLDTCMQWVPREKQVLLPIPMGEMNRELYREQAAMIDRSLKQGETAVYLTIGDALCYSTAVLLSEFLPSDIRVVSLPGIPSFLAACHRLFQPLAMKGERFLLLDEWHEEIREILPKIDSLALLKVGREPGKMMRELEEAGFRVRMVSSLELPEERITDRAEELTEPLPYLSLLLARKKD